MLVSSLSSLEKEGSSEDCSDSFSLEISLLCEDSMIFDSVSPLDEESVEEERLLVITEDSEGSDWLVEGVLEEEELWEGAPQEARSIVARIKGKRRYSMSKIYPYHEEEATKASPKKENATHRCVVSLGFPV